MAKKVTMKLTELGEPEVSHISLVDRGAMRTPFKIFKSEDGMKDGKRSLLDLGTLFMAKKTEEKTPVVIGIATKAESSDGIIAALKERGYEEVIKHEQEDGVVLALKEDADLTDGILLKVNDEAAVVVGGVEKSFYSWPDGSDFADNVQKAAFWPGIHVASEVLLDTVYNIMEQTEKGDSPVERVQKAVNDFGSYVSALVGAVPAEAFKMESLTPLVVTAKAEDEPGDEPTPDAGGDPEGGDGKETTVKEEGEEPEPDAGGGEEPAPGTEEPEAGAEEEPAPGTGGEPEKVEKQDDKDDLKDLITAALSPLTEVVTALKTEVETIKGTSTQALELAKKADENINGTVLGTEHADGKQTTHKQEEKKPIFDTAFDFPGEK